MKKKFKRNVKKNYQHSLNKLNLFQVSKFQSKKKCPLSEKNAPKIDYKNVKLLKDTYRKMVKFYHLELHPFLKTNKENSRYQLKEQEFWR